MSEQVDRPRVDQAAFGIGIQLEDGPFQIFIIQVSLQADRLTASVCKDEVWKAPDAQLAGKLEVVLKGDAGAAFVGFGKSKYIQSHFGGCGFKVFPAHDVLFLQEKHFPYPSQVED